MEKISKVREKLKSGELDGAISRLMVGDAVWGRKRMETLIDGYCRTFSKDGEQEISLCSAPGRTEICGNHTDHQRGKVLAGAVNLDFAACGGYNDKGVIRFKSHGWNMVEIDIGDLAPKESEKGSTAALVRGMASQAKDRGYELSGMDIYADSMVMPGSGLSSSAACEVLLGVIINHLFCNDELSSVVIAQMGQAAENIFFGKPCGLMDQMASSVGGVVAIDFEKDGEPEVTSLNVDLAAMGYALCIINTGASHANLTDEYAAVPEEMKSVAEFFGKEVLREVTREQVIENLPKLREAAGDRAVLRSLHFFGDNERVDGETKALTKGNMEEFLRLVRSSGRSSWELLQNITPAGAVREQPMAVALALAEELLGDRGACRVHGGGFAGTIQAFVPQDMITKFKAAMEAALGQGSVYELQLRPAGGTVVLP